MKKDWIRVDFGKVASLQRGYDLTHRERKPGTVPVVTSTGITDTHAVARERGPGVITGRYGTIGEVFFVEEDYWPHNTTLFVKDFHGNDPSFIAYLLRTIDFQTHSGKSGVPGVNRNDLHQVTVLIPPTVEEQREIAHALNDVDDLLGGLDHLIGKKRDLKQATMQQLLTGQTRLPGFQGEWKSRRLGDLADIRTGGTPSTGDPCAWNGKILWCTPTDITALAGRKYLAQTSSHITSHGLKNSSAEIIPERSVVMTSRATIGECAINVVPISTNQGFKNFVPFETVDVEFLFYSLLRQKQGFIRLCGGSTFLEISKTQLSAYEVSVPAERSEQTAIAEVLMDIDVEIAMLEQRREKTRRLKQAMMQELLTGKTRLI